MRGVEGGRSGRAGGGCCMDCGGVQEMAAYGSESVVRRSGARGGVCSEKRSVWATSELSRWLRKRKGHNHVHETLVAWMVPVTSTS